MKLEYQVNTGDGKQLYVHNFLGRISEIHITRGISEREISDSAIDLFVGKA